MGTLLPLRLVLAILVGASPLLNEELTVYGLTGSAIVIVSLGIYLFLLYRLSVKEGQSKPSMRSSTSESLLTSEVMIEQETLESVVAVNEKL